MMFSTHFYRLGNQDIKIFGDFQAIIHLHIYSFFDGTDPYNSRFFVNNHQILKGVIHTGHFYDLKEGEDFS